MQLNVVTLVCVSLSLPLSSVASPVRVRNELESSRNGIARKPTDLLNKNFSIGPRSLDRDNATILNTTSIEEPIVESGSFDVLSTTLSEDQITGSFFNPGSVV